MGRGTLGEVRDGSRDPREGPGRVERPSEWSGTGQGTLREVRDGSGTLGEVWDRLVTLGKFGDGLGDPL